MAIIDGGRLIARDAPAVLVQAHFPGTLVRLPPGALPADTPLPSGAERRGDTVEITTEDAERTIQSLLTAGVPLGELQVASPTLEDVFLKLTGHGLRG